MNRRRVAGITLLELMIVVAIIGIIAAIAYPSFVDQVRKSRRAQAKECLQALELNQEKWRANHVKYSGSLSEIWFQADDGNYYCSNDDEKRYYQLDPNNILPADEDDQGFKFRVHATALGDQANDKARGVSCGDMYLSNSSIDADGEYVADGETGYTRTPAECWR